MRWQTIYEARWILLILVGLLVLSTWASFWLVGVWALLICYTFYFFRDPVRTIPPGENLVVAAADGVVADITPSIFEGEVTKQDMQRLGIFLSVFDVHTNRAPLAGKIIYRQHHLGKYLDARHPDATTLNEYVTWGLEHARTTLVMRQITGAIARRIVPWKNAGDIVEKGQHFGMIRFGSRTEIYLPLDATLLVKIGDRVKSGSSPVARLAE